MNQPEFAYVDITRVDKDGKNQSWKRVPVAELDKWRIKMIELESKHCYSTIQRFANEKHVEGETYISPMYFDLDSDNNLQESLDDARKLKHYMITFVGFDDDDERIKVFFSGNRGFHFEIDPGFIGITAASDLCKVLHWMAEHIANKLSLKTLDMSVYSKRRMWRLTNTQHGKSGLWKIPITMTEIGFLGVSDIRELATGPRVLEVDE